MRQEILFNYHKYLCGAHQGINKLQQLLNARFFWPEMRQDIKRYVKTCHECQIRKAPNTRPFGDLQHIKASQPFEVCSIDHVGPLPKSYGCTYILVLTCIFSKFAIAKAVRSTSARIVADFLFREVFLRMYVAPRHLLSDQSKSFLNKTIDELNLMFGTVGIKTTSYNPTTNGQCEHMNGTVVNMLSHYTNRGQSNWAKYVLPVTYAYNSMKHETTKF